jgi:hypothetical protein
MVTEKFDTDEIKWLGKRCGKHLTPMKLSGLEKGVEKFDADEIKWLGKRCGKNSTPMKLSG